LLIPTESGLTLTAPAVIIASLFHRSNGYYYFLSLVNGHRVWKLTGFKKKSEAMEYLSESRRKTREKPALAMNQFKTQFLGYLQSIQASSTVALYKSGFNKFVSLHGNLSLNEITP
jgi:hypothetical protein